MRKDGKNNNRYLAGRECLGGQQYESIEDDAQGVVQQKILEQVPPAFKAMANNFF